MSANGPEPDIKQLFEPQSIAIIGASSNPNKIGHKILANVLSGGYKGRVYPVNPRGDEILGLRVYESIDAIDDAVDIACIVIPAPYVLNEVKHCAAKGVKFIPIITSGFSEVGNIQTEREIVAHARANGTRILGPNIFGIYSAQASLNATFGPDHIRAGQVAIVTQSGALGIAMIGKTAVEHIGLSAIVSVGNKSDIDEADLLAYLAVHDNTKVILMYIEGVRDGQRLIEALKQATQRKPVIVIKSGRSKRGAVAAASHTGSLAGADEVFDDIMRQCGVLRAETLEDAFNWCKFLADAPLPKGNNTVIITNGGGIGVMATDACEKHDVPLYDDPHTLREIFAGVTPEFGSTKNPIDLTGQATAQHYNAALSTARENNDVSAVIALYCETAVFDTESLAGMVAQNYNRYQSEGKPIIFSLLGGEMIDSSLASLRKQHVPVFADVYDTVSCLGAAYWFRRYLTDASDEIEMVDLDTQHIETIAGRALVDGRSFLMAHEAQQLIEASGIRSPRSRIAHNLDDVVRFAEDIGYPVVLKIVSKDILHKSDAGGVALDLDNRSEVIDAYEAIIHNCRTHQPGAIIDGIEVSEMVAPGTEVIIGARRDKTFGPIVMFGLGGIYVEVMKDVSFRALPVGRSAVMSMIKEIKSYPLLLGVRGEGTKDIDSIVDTIIRLATVIQTCDNITDIEINPLMVYEQGQGAKAVDIRVLVSNAERGSTHG